MRLKVNTDYFRSEMLNVINWLIDKINNIGILHIRKLYVENNIAITNGLNGTELSNKAIVCGTPIDKLNKCINYIYNHQQTIASASIDLNLLESHIIYVNDPTQTSYRKAIGKRTVQIPVPEGFDGNMSYINFTIDDNQLPMKLVAINEPDDFTPASQSNKYGYNVILEGKTYAVDAKAALYEIFKRLDFSVKNPVSLFAAFGKGDFEISYAKHKNFIEISYGAKFFDDDGSLLDDQTQKTFIQVDETDSISFADGASFTAMPNVNCYVEFYKRGM